MEDMIRKLRDLDFVIGVNLEKSKREKTEDFYPVRIGISSQNVDRQNEVMVLKSVFDTATINKHMEEGYVDYDHLSFRAKNPIIQAQAICGKPYDFEWVTKSGLGEVPVVECNLFRGNPYVDRALIPAFDSGNKVFGASIGGKTILKSDGQIIAGKKVAHIHKIRWIHNAITPIYKAVNQDAFVESIAKSLMGITALALEDFQFEESTIKSFPDLIKNMVANEGITDYSSLQGGPALQQQSSEPEMVSQILSALLDSAMLQVRMGELKNNLDEIVQWFKMRGCPDSVCYEYAKAIMDKYSQIEKLQFA